MSLKNQITDDMKKYMKEKNQIGLDTIRMLRAEIKNMEINTKTELDDEAVQKVIATAIKKRKDAAEQYKDAGRDELAEKELKEIEFLTLYMPEQLSEDEIREVVAKVIDENEETGPRAMGMVMKNSMAKLQGKADGKLVNNIVRELLNGNA